jgi:hypothetical protein
MLTFVIAVVGAAVAVGDTLTTATKMLRPLIITRRRLRQKRSNLWLMDEVRARIVPEGRKAFTVPRA